VCPQALLEALLSPLRRRPVEHIVGALLPLEAGREVRERRRRCGRLAFAEPLLRWLPEPAQPCVTRRSTRSMLV